jgi:hypothetical protein
VATALKIVRYITVPIETLRPGDFVLARDEHDADGELVLRQVEEVFQRTAYRLQIITLRSSTGIVQTIQTTAEHPVYALDQEWTTSRDRHGCPRTARAPVAPSKSRRHDCRARRRDFHDYRGSHRTASARHSR